jgi:hypothetical protein
MAPTSDEILAQEERLKQEIADKEILLNALQILRSQIGKGDDSSAAPSGELATDAPKISVQTAPSSASLPPVPARYAHPELVAISARRGTKGDIVAWAIQRMTDDYSVADIVALLRREGANLSGAEISVVISRLKNRGEIEEIRQGRGRKGSIFRKRDNAISREGTSTNQPSGPSSPRRVFDRTGISDVST